MNPFKKKKTEITDLEIEYISLVTDNYSPVNGKDAIVKAEEKKKLIFKANRVIKGIAEGVFMVADEVDKQGDYYSFETVQKAAIEVMKSLKDGKMDLFNKNHTPGHVSDINVVDMRIDYVEKAWKGSIDFSKNEEIMKAAESGNFNGFSIEGFGARIEKAMTVQESLNENKRKNPLGQLTGALMKTIDDIVYDYEMSDVDKKGSLELAVLDYFDLANKEIDSIFNISNNQILKSAEVSEMEFTEQNKKELKEILKALLAEEKQALEASKIEKAKDDEIEQLKKTVEELKKAQTTSEAGKDEGDGNKVEKASKPEIDNSVF
jgi:hypothetical protein